jgi:hypothetical protein
LGGSQTIEKEDEGSDVKNREWSGGSKSQTHIEVEAMVTKRIERTTEVLCRVPKRHRTGSRCDKRVFEN